MPSDRRDVFISHASEDKEAIARPLAEQLRARGCTVWFDDYELVLGDSLRDKIGDGLRHSRAGVVILSPDFFAKRWPRWELDGLTARQLAGEENVILPVLHEVQEDDVRSYSPPLADLVAAKSSDGVDAVADAVVRVLRSRLAGGGPKAALAGARTPSAPSSSSRRRSHWPLTRRRGVITLAAVSVTAAALTLLIILAALNDHGCGFQIKAPENGQKLTDRRGTTLQGSACSNDYVWIFDYDDGDHHYYGVSRKPADVIGGQWSQADESIGDESDPVGTQYRIVAVRVSRACNRALQASRPDADGENRWRFPRHPARCPPLKSAADTQSVVVVKRR